MVKWIIVFLPLAVIAVLAEISASMDGDEVVERDRVPISLEAGGHSQVAVRPSRPGGSPEDSQLGGNAGRRAIDVRSARTEGVEASPGLLVVEALDPNAGAPLEGLDGWFLDRVELAAVDWQLAPSD